MLIKASFKYISNLFRIYYDYFLHLDKISAQDLAY